MSMELIDKDKIKYLSIPIAPILVGEDVHYEMGALKEWIDEMPTVKAIPIERLEQIRAEVKQLPNANPSYWYTCDVVEREDVLELIDKALKEQNE